MATRTVHSLVGSGVYCKAGRAGRKERGGTLAVEKVCSCAGEVLVHVLSGTPMDCQPDVLQKLCGKVVGWGRRGTTAQTHALDRNAAYCKYVLTYCCMHSGSGGERGRDRG